MDSIIARYLIQALSGAFTGYITNTYAINMLFREYTPLKIGGVIKKTRPEFIENVSSLVERDIINHKTLIKEIEKEEFQKNMDDFSNVLLKESAYSENTDARIGDIPGYGESARRLIDFTKELMDEYMEPLVRKALSKVSVDSFLSGKRLETAVEKLVGDFAEIVKRDKSLGEALEKATKEMCAASPEKLAGDGLRDTLHYCVDFAVSKVHKSLGKSHSGEVESAVAEIMDVSGAGSVIRHAEKLINSKKIKDIIGDDSKGKLFDEIVEKASGFMDSEQGKRLFDEFASRMMEYAKGIDKPVLDLVSQEFKPSVEDYLRKNVPHAVALVIEWIEGNKPEIESLIQEAVDEEVESAEGMKGMVLGLIKNSLLKDIAKKYEIVAKIVDYLENRADIDTISRDITEYAIEFLRKKSVRDIVAMLEDRGLVSAQTLSDIMIQNIKRYMGRLPERYFERIGQKLLGDIFEIDLVKIFDEKLRGWITRGICEKFIYSGEAKEKAAKILKDSIDRAWEEEVSNLLSNKDSSGISRDAKEALCRFLSGEKSSISKRLSESIRNRASEMSLAQIAGKSGELAVCEAACSRIEHLMEDYSGRIGRMKVEEALGRLNSVNGIDYKVSAMLQKIVKGNLEGFVEGNIKSLVAKNIGRLDDDELCEMVQEFMGKELKPITGFGAVLGLFAGIALASFESSNIYVNIPVYALVGWITNVIAIWMIFRPYKEIGLLANIPVASMFSQGYIAKNKPKFAKSMSRFVEEELLDRDSINRTFESQKSDIEESILWKLSSGNYESVGLAIGRYRDGISDALKGFVQKAAIGRKSEVAGSIADYLLGGLFKEDGAQNVEKKLNAFFKRKLASSQELIEKQLLKLSRSNEPISNKMPKAARKAACEKLESGLEGVLEGAAGFASDHDRVVELINSHSKGYERAIGKPVAEIAGKEGMEKLKGSIQFKIDELLVSGSAARRMIRGLEKALESEFSRDETVAEIFGGAVKRFVDENADDILEKIVRALKRGVSSFAPAVRESAKDSVKAELSMLQKGMYAMFGGDSIIEGIVDKIMEEKVPAFIDGKKSEIRAMAKEIIENRIYKTRLSEFEISANRSQILIAIEEFMSNEENARAVANAAGGIAIGAAQSMALVPAREYLEIVSLSSIEDVIERFEADIMDVEGFCGEEMRKNLKCAAKTGAKSAEGIIEREIGQTSLSDMLSVAPNIDEAIREASSKLGGFAAKSAGMDDVLDAASGGLIEKVRKEGLDCYIERESLVEEIEGLILSLMLDAEIEGIVGDLSIDAVRRMEKGNAAFLHTQTKHHISGFLVSCMADALGKTLPQILRDIDFKGITRDEINSMEPSEIHRLFNSFAGDYFTRLRLYGLFGGVFGTHPGVGAAAAALFFASEARSRKTGDDIHK